MSPWSMAHGPGRKLLSVDPVLIVDPVAYCFMLACLARCARLTKPTN